jgi:hypothetical protein
MCNLTNPTPEAEKVQPGAIRPNQLTDKSPFVAVVNADTGEVNSTVVTDVSGAHGSARRLPSMWTWPRATW